MSSSTRTALLVAVLVVLTVVLSLVPADRRDRRVPSDVGGARYRVLQEEAQATGAAVLPVAVRERALRFAGDVSPTDREAVAAAITRARPEARRLVEMVDGLVTVSTGTTGGETLGLTLHRGDGYEIVLDLDDVTRRHGQRGVDRVVLHELGHVVDAAIVPDGLVEMLDSQVPIGYACRPGEPTGACAPRDERFAESFAKWATNDIGVDLFIGYKVPPPAVTLDAWGRPLADLAAN
jgi:hypothetical protein